MEGIWDEVLGQKTKVLSKSDTSELEIGIDQILGMRLSELSKRNIALRIYSEVLGCEIWLCDNEQMATQLRQDDPETTAYTANEMKRLISLKPDPKELMNTHIAKTIFPGSKIIDVSLRETSDKSEDAQND